MFKLNQYSRFKMNNSFTPVFYWNNDGRDALFCHHVQRATPIRVNTDCLPTALVAILCPLYHSHNRCDLLRGCWKCCSTNCRFHCKTHRDTFFTFLLLSNLLRCQEKNVTENRCDLVGTFGHGHENWDDFATGTWKKMRKWEYSITDKLPWLAGLNRSATHVIEK